MEKWSEKDEEDDNNMKEENRLEMTLSPVAAGHIFDGGAMNI